MTRRLFAALFVCCFMGSVAAVAADKPDFSGKWKLNTEKSDFGPMPKPEKADYVIAHKDPELNVKSTATAAPRMASRGSAVIEMPKGRAIPATSPASCPSQRLPGDAEAPASRMPGNSSSVRTNIRPIRPLTPNRATP